MSRRSAASAKSPAARSAARSAARPVPPADCPCCSGRAYAECCGALHGGRERAATAEALMRSRYSAFVLGDAGYLERTWHPSTRPGRLELDSATRWTRLEVLGSTGGGPFHTEGTVEFNAHYRDRGGDEQVMHENSAFVREDGAWVYLSAL